MKTLIFIIIGSNLIFVVINCILILFLLCYKCSMLYTAQNSVG